MLLIALLFIEIKALNSISCLCSELSLEQECLYAGCEWITNTNQCIARSPINQPNCSDYEDQLVCDFLQGCAWNNQGKCEQFTQCSDYVIDQYDTSDQCYLKDQTCRNGQINNQGFITCQSIDQFCIDYTNELMTVDFDDKHYLITQEDTNQTAIMKFRYNSINNCIIQQNSLIGCSSIKNEIICKFVKNKYKTLLCEWINNQCTESLNTPLLNVDNCYLQSGGTHSWQNNICQTCKGQDLQKKNRILAELLNAPTLTQSTKQEKLTQFSEKVTYYFPASYVQNCSKTQLLTQTHNCFAENCTKSTISKEQSICLFYGGEKYDILSRNWQFDKICFTDSQSLTVKNGPNYTLTNQTTLCFQTSQRIDIDNGVKATPIIQKSNSTNNCITKSLTTSTTTGNLNEECHIVTNTSTLLIWDNTDSCDSVTETIIQPDKLDSTKPFSFITTAKSCKQIYANQSPQIDTIIHEITNQTPQYGETIMTSKQIGGNQKLTYGECKSNFTVNRVILNSNASFFNETQNTIRNSDCPSYSDNDVKTTIRGVQVYNETLKTEIYTLYNINP